MYSYIAQLGHSKWNQHKIQAMKPGNKFLIQSLLIIKFYYSSLPFVILKLYAIASLSLLLILYLDVVLTLPLNININAYRLSTQVTQITLCLCNPWVYWCCNNNQKAAKYGYDKVGHTFIRETFHSWFI